jgi:probable HAF family extracellular repeat protein
MWEHGVIEELPILRGDQDANPIAINDRGQAVGWSGICRMPLHAVLWQDGILTDLGTLGGMAQ